MYKQLKHLKDCIHVDKLMTEADSKDRLIHFYSILVDQGSSPIYLKMKNGHIAYLKELLILEEVFFCSDYNRAVIILNEIIVKYQSAIYQGRLYYGLLFLMERYLEDEISFILGKSTIPLRKIMEPTIFEYHIDEDNVREVLNKQIKFFSNMNDEDKKFEFRRFPEIIKKVVSNSISENQARKFDFLFEAIKIDLKTDPLTLLQHHNDLHSQHEIMRIVRENNFPFRSLASFYVNGAFYYLSDDKSAVVHSTKDYRIAMLLAINQIRGG
ncbi:hypothetical protein [Oceanobacillus oncorhynchi]|uniref:hypothetical protein n=1 Tax=Oceanobacillus oncorhynchi TaxID=545501 RepID=UPI00186624FC|nr:hypothetical protein [Oceanobacillus oncorhynchi]